MFFTGIFSKIVRRLAKIPDGFTADSVKIESSICTGERVIGFWGEKDKKLHFAEAVKSDKDIDAFYQKYGIERRK